MDRKKIFETFNTRDLQNLYFKFRSQIVDVEEIEKLNENLENYNVIREILNDRRHDWLEKTHVILKLSAVEQIELKAYLKNNENDNTIIDYGTRKIIGEMVEKLPTWKLADLFKLRIDFERDSKGLLLRTIFEIELNGN